MKDNRINYDLERKLRRYAIGNLMKYIVIGQGIVFALMYIWPTLGYRLYSLISLTRAGLMRGQIWRLVTFVFTPPSSSPIFILFALYFYYMIGLGLENQWGKVRFNLYYGVGMLGSIIAALITGYGSNMFLNLSLFFAYAALYPDEQVLLFMFLPIKMKYLALADAALYLYYFIVGGASTRVTIVLCLLNVFLFLGGDIINTIRRESRYWKTRYNFISLSPSSAPSESSRTGRPRPAPCPDRRDRRSASGFAPSSAHSRRSPAPYTAARRKRRAWRRRSPPRAWRSSRPRGWTRTSPPD